MCKCETKAMRLIAVIKLTLRHLDVASWICINGNNFVESSSKNVLIKITVNLRQTSQKYPWETKCELVINLVTKEWRKAVDTPLPKWHVVSRYCS